MVEEADFVSGLDAQTREAFKKTFDAMSEWRDQITVSTDQYTKKAFDALAVAARGVGWPDSLIETTKTQLLHASAMQTQMIDHMIEAWKDQLKSPVSPGKFMDTLSQDVVSADLENAVANPAKFWMQATEMWQKNWSDAMATWMGGKQGK
jgi:hypothetical protein